MSAGDGVGGLVTAIEPLDADAATAARARNDQLVKPPGSLGRLEEVGAWLASVYGSCPPPVPERPAAVVCAGDHGVLAQGVSAWPKEVTAIMVGEFCAERAAVNALGRTVGASVTVLDVGVASDVPAHPRLKRFRVRDGTADLHDGPAMTNEEAARAVLVGAQLVTQLIDQADVDLVLTGDMGVRRAGFRGDRVSRFLCSLIERGSQNVLRFVECFHFCRRTVAE
ncbi:MAG: nicotinate-nucleotide--dimethylbenzimidazole phosphoribosyltransferase, partial [Solirubrobacteraceae bacterium]